VITQMKNILYSLRSDINCTDGEGLAISREMHLSGTNTINSPVMWMRVISQFLPCHFFPVRSHRCVNLAILGNLESRNHSGVLQRDCRHSLEAATVGSTLQRRPAGYRAYGTFSSATRMCVVHTGGYLLHRA